jgi:protocatechuate 3,4-dioxygenase beta subunit
MKARLSMMMFLFTVFIGLQTFAQERTVKGTVTDDSGMPVPGVSVLVK